MFKKTDVGEKPAGGNGIDDRSHTSFADGQWKSI